MTSAFDFPFTVPNPTANKRYLGDTMDCSICPNSNQFVAIADNRAVMACGYFDQSFRVFAMDTGNHDNLRFKSWPEMFAKADCQPNIRALKLVL